MNLNELFQQQGLGVMATASKDGAVNTAVYARPHIIDENTLVWGMTDKRTFSNVSHNPFASYLFKASAPGFTGCRLSLEMIKYEDGGDLLTRIKKNTDEIVGPGAGEAVTHAVWFRVTEIRPLI